MLIVYCTLLFQNINLKEIETKWYHYYYVERITILVDILARTERARRFVVRLNGNSSFVFNLVEEAVVLISRDGDIVEVGERDGWWWRAIRWGHMSWVLILVYPTIAICTYCFCSGAFLNDVEGDKWIFEHFAHKSNNAKSWLSYHAIVQRNVSAKKITRILHHSWSSVTYCFLIILHLESLVNGNFLCNSKIQQ